jgi:plastocyanin
VATASDTQKVLLEDDCDPLTFNTAGQALFQQNLCEEDFDGSVTFGEFLDALVLDGGHDAWKFNPNHATISQGESLKAINTGGESHSFTEVEDFGGGIIPQINQMLGGLEPVPEAQDPNIFGPTIIAPGDSLTVTDLNVGTHRFMCVLHPWQRSVIKVTK